MRSPCYAVSKINMTILKIIGTIFLLGIVGTIVQGMRSWGTTAKATFAPETGLFAPCPASPNCVSTQAPATDTEHAIAAIPFVGSAEAAKSRLLATVQTMPRLTIITDADHYLHVEARTPLMRYVDDVEFYIDSVSQTIHFRSASRIGRGDLGANRQRMEEFRQRFVEQ